MFDKDHTIEKIACSADLDNLTGVGLSCPDRDSFSLIDNAGTPKSHKMRGNTEQQNLANVMNVNDDDLHQRIHFA